MGVKFCIVTKSVTYALKASKILSNNGFKTSVSKDPNSATGCKYCVYVNNDEHLAIDILSKNGIGIIDMYRA